MSRTKLAVRAALAVGVLILLGLGAAQAYEWLQIDTCHDRGGSWHHDVKACSYTESYRGPR